MPVQRQWHVTEMDRASFQVQRTRWVLCTWQQQAAPVNRLWTDRVSSGAYSYNSVV